MINLHSATIKKFQNFDVHQHLKEHYPDLDNYVTETIKLKGNNVYKAIFRSKNIYQIVRGAVKLGTYNQEGKPFIYEVLGDGDFFGNFEYLENKQFYEYSKTMIDCKLRVYNLDFIKRVVMDDPILTDWFIRYLVKRWCNAEKKVKMSNEKGTTEKLRYLSTYFDNKVHDYSGNEYVLFNLLTQKDLGDLIGTTRQSIAAALEKL
ncbi:Crp/Fnr family transcriptional regulator [Seonamhaeicola algicola]|uniref:Crp/Fnr family transcriptional regulator n=1 Tax=Seonamhaeicola algicola TaxID=1719036 RepID=A0A5C7AY76_9FLAO|nr:Crp/Fnr family transcriptional regulator [Seonamhaeicola algicola]TXE13117.1 Crp/Fnr family transcriptional regulator [Seonamhaeicola algicola]